jgi:hypothetical protein
MSTASSPSVGFRVRWLQFFLLIFVLLLSLVPAWAGIKWEQLPGVHSAAVEGKPTNLAASGQALIEVSPTTTTADLQEILAGRGCRLLTRYRAGHGTVALVGLPAGATVPQGLALLAAAPRVLKALPDLIVYRTGQPSALPPVQPSVQPLAAAPLPAALTPRVPNDPQYKNQYQWPLCFFPPAWAITTGRSSTVIADIDSGLDVTHPDLVNKLWTGFYNNLPIHGWNFVASPNSGDLTDNLGDGTFAAGLIGAATNNHLGVAGADWNCQIMMLKVFDITGYTSDSTVIEALQFALDNNANIINIGVQGSYTDSFTQPIADAFYQGVVVCATAGNYGVTFTNDSSTWQSPVCNDGPDPGDNFVLGVAYCDSNKRLASFSAVDGSTHQFVDLVAPGENVLSTYPLALSSTSLTPGYTRMSGLASPIVAGAAGLFMDRYPSATPDRVIQLLRQTCTKIDAQNPKYKGKMGGGLLDIAAALTPQPPGPAEGVAAFGTPNSEGGSITVTWSPSADDGTGQDNVTKYELFRSGSATGSFTLLKTFKAGLGTYSYTDSAVTNGTPYFYRVNTYAGTVVTPSQVVGPAEATDTLAPGPVTTLKATAVPSAQGGAISLGWAGYTSSDPNFSGFKVYRSAAAFTDVSGATPLTGAGPVYLLATFNNTTVRSYLDSTTTNGVNYWYAVTAFDAVGNEDKTVAPVGPVESFPTLTVIYPQGLSMIALPLLPPTTDMGKILGIGGPIGIQLAAYDPSSPTSYDFYATDPTSPLLQAALGRAYWLQASASLRIALGGTPAPAGDFTAGLGGGWNMLGNPFTAPIVFGQSQILVGGTAESLNTSNANGQTDNFGWVYDHTQTPPGYKLVSGSLPFATRTVAEGQGFWFYGNVVGGFIFQRPTGAQAVPASRPAPPAPTEDNWYLRLGAAVSGAADPDNFLGVSAQAAALSGLRKPPAVAGGVELSFAGAGQARTATSFHQPGAAASWDLQVAAPAGAPVTLSWPDLATLPDSVRPLLTDLVTGQSVYVRTAPLYRFAAGAKPRAFRLTLAAEGAVMLSSVSATTGAGRAEITYALAAPAQVTVEVLNLSGRLVRVVSAATPAAAGLGTAVWDGRNLTGAAVPAGTYIVRVTAQNDTGQRVSVVRTLSLHR